MSRYLLLAQVLEEFGRQQTRYEFLLAASPKIAISARLHDAYSRLAPTTSFQCPTQVFGYPQGPTAMFWDALDYVAQEMNQAPGFSLWLESDMTIVKPDWMDRLDAGWAAIPAASRLLMGNVVPDVYRHRIFRRPKRLLNSHVNGGACYAKSFAMQMPPAARQGVFDMAVYPYVQAVRGVHHTELICFSTVERAERDVADPTKVILHGFMQDKDQFVQRCAVALQRGQFADTAWQRFSGQLERWRRQVRVHFVKRGPQAMLENVLLTQDQHRRRRAA